METGYTLRCSRVIIDIYDRYIVGWSIHEEESEVHGRELFEMISCGRNISFEYLHADNGIPMKGASLMAFLQHLHVKVSFSRPRTKDICKMSTIGIKEQIKVVKIATLDLISFMEF